MKWFERIVLWTMFGYCLGDFVAHMPERIATLRAWFS